VGVLPGTEPVKPLQLLLCPSAPAVASTDKKHSWGPFGDVGAVMWPLFSLRPRSFTTDGGRPGRCSEDAVSGLPEHATDFELEFAVRWARKGAVTAKIFPGACMRDVSKGISSFERMQQ